MKKSASSTTGLLLTYFFIFHPGGADPELELGAMVQSWTLGGIIDFFEKFLNTIVCYRKYCCLGGHGPLDLPLHATEKGNGAILLEVNHYMNKIENLLFHGCKFKKYSQT